MAPRKRVTTLPAIPSRMQEAPIPAMPASTAYDLALSSRRRPVAQAPAIAPAPWAAPTAPYPALPRPSSSVTRKTSTTLTASPTTTKTHREGTRIRSNLSENSTRSPAPRAPDSRTSVRTGRRRVRTRRATTARPTKVPASTRRAARSPDQATSKPPAAEPDSVARPIRAWLGNPQHQGDHGDRVAGVRDRPGGQDQPGIAV